MVIEPRVVQVTVVRHGAMGFVVCEVVEIEAIKDKDKLKNCVVRIGDEKTLRVVTNCSNVRLGTRTVVAEIGTELEINGESIVIKKQTVGGVLSEGMLVDSCMLGWSGGAVGICVQIPPSFALGSAPPKSKPRLDGVEESPVVELSQKEIKLIEKEKRKKELAEKKAKRKAEKGGIVETDADETDEVAEAVESIQINEDI